MKIWTGYPYLIALSATDALRYLQIVDELGTQFTGGINAEYGQDDARPSVFEENGKLAFGLIGCGVEYVVNVAAVGQPKGKKVPEDVVAVVVLRGASVAYGLSCAETVQRWARVGVHAGGRLCAGR